MSEIVIHENDTPQKDQAVQDLEREGILVPLTTDQKDRIRERASKAVAEFKDLRPQSKEFQERVDAIHNLAADEIHLAGEGASRLLAKRSSTARGAQNAGSEIAVRTQNSLTDLATVVSDIQGRDKILGFIPIPLARRVERMQRQHQTAQEKIDHIDESLHQSEEELAMDSAALLVEQEDLRVAMGKISEYIELAEIMDGELTTQISALREAGREGEAKTVETTMLMALRQRKHDLSTQMAVAAQSYMTMGVIRANNHELAQGVKRARNSTMSVLKNSMAIAEALSTQERVLGTVEALDAVANQKMRENAAALKTQAGRIHQRSISSGVTVETLEASFKDLFATVENINKVKNEAVGAISAQEDKLRTMLNGIAPRVQQLALSSGDQPEQKRYELTVD